MTHPTHLFRLGVAVGILVATVVSAQSTVEGRGRNDRKTATRAGSVTVRVTPLFAFTGSVVQAMVRVTPDADNRLLRIMVDSEAYFQSSDVGLAGLDAAIPHYIPMKGLPAGHYDLVAVVYGTQGERARIGGQFRLLSSSETSEDGPWMQR